MDEVIFGIQAPNGWWEHSSDWACLAARAPSLLIPSCRMDFQANMEAAQVGNQSSFLPSYSVPLILFLKACFNVRDKNLAKELTQHREKPGAELELSFGFTWIWSIVSSSCKHFWELYFQATGRFMFQSQTPSEPLVLTYSFQQPFQCRSCVLFLFGLKMGKAKADAELNNPKPATTKTVFNILIIDSSKGVSCSAGSRSWAGVTIT